MQHKSETNFHIYSLKKWQRRHVLSPSFNLFHNRSPVATLENTSNSLRGNRAHNRLFNAFFERIHVWFPFFHIEESDRQDWTLEHINLITPYEHLISSSKNCMVLMILALGSLAENNELDAQESPESQFFAQAAFSMLPDVVAGMDLTSVHCLILFMYSISNANKSLYYQWQMKPSQVQNYIGMAAAKLQTILSVYLT
jgi:hypothetical protein